MIKNSNNKGSIELWGQEFTRVKSGLDEEQIVPFVTELISERDTLQKRQEHLSSLATLAERTVAEADNVAEKITEEALERAEAESKMIIDKAEEQAQQIVDEKMAEVTAAAEESEEALKRAEAESKTIIDKAAEQAQQIVGGKMAEATAAAEEKAEAIKTKAQHQAEQLLEEKTREIRTELMDMAQPIYKELLSQLENLKHQVTSFEADFAQMLSRSMEQVNLEAVKEDDIIPAADTAMIEATNDTPTEDLEQTRTAYTVDTIEQMEEAVAPDKLQEAEQYEEDIELEIQPPVDISKIMAIITYLDNMAEVKTTELIPITGRPLILTSLCKPLNTVEVLMRLPEVKEAIEVTNFANEDGERRRIQITLSGNAYLDEAKGKLSDGVSQIFSS